MGVLAQPVANGTQGGSIISIPAGSSATSTVPTALNNGVCRSNHLVVITPTSGVTDGNVAIQGSLDGVNYVTLASILMSVLPGQTVYVAVSGTPMIFIQALILANIVGGTIQANVASSG
jgi:hypothetical protein